MKVLTLGLLALAVGGTGCSADSGENDAGSPGPTDTGAIHDSGTGGTDALPDSGSMDAAALPDVGDRFDAEPTDTGISGGTFDLTGTWSSRVINSQCFDGTLGKDTVQITTISLIHVTQAAGSAMTTTEVCDIKLTPYKGNQTTYPPAAISAVIVPPQLSALSGDTIGSTYVPARRVALLGWTATGDPATEAVPTMDTDPRISDVDGDGHPGVTFQVDGTIDGEVYIVNRNIVDINAVVTGADRIEGHSHTVQEQKVVAAMPNLLRFNSITATPNPDANSSTFLMVRLAPATDTCAEIVAAANTIFTAPTAVTPCP